jgi:hypothetical protein
MDVLFLVSLSDKIRVHGQNVLHSCPLLFDFDEKLKALTDFREMSCLLSRKSFSF